MRFLLVFMGLAGCGPPAIESATPPAMACNAARPESLIGRVATAAVAGEARRLSGARSVRLLRPGQIVTMEYRANRLNLHLDARDKIIRIVCG